jgi:hypothetical protein
MTTFRVNFAAPRQSSFYAVCVGEDGLRINPGIGALSPSVSHATSAVSLSLVKFPIYTASIPASRLGKVKINICIYERSGSSPSLDDLMVAHDEGVWDPDMSLLVRSSDPLQSSARVFASMPENRLDTFAILGSRNGQANVFVDRATKLLVAKISLSPSGSPVSSISLRSLNDRMMVSSVIQRSVFVGPYMGVKFALSSSDHTNAINSGTYAICIESARGEVVGIGSPMGGVRLVQAGNPGIIEVTTLTMPARDLRKF